MRLAGGFGFGDESSDYAFFERYTRGFELGGVFLEDNDNCFLAVRKS